MGGHHSHARNGEGSGFNTPRAGSKRGATPRGSTGEADRVDRPQPTSMVPVEKLGKLLAQRSQREDGISGITEKCITKYLFPLYPELARRFFGAIVRAQKPQGAPPAQAQAHATHVSLNAFRAHCERVLAMLDDDAIIETYVKMFSSATDENSIEPEGLRGLLHTSYQLSMDHYPEGPQTCLQINKTLSWVVAGCFNNKESHSAGFVVRWLNEHCHRLIFPVHRYVVHTLATRHRDVAAAQAQTAGAEDGSGAGLELATPVLERSPWAAGTAQRSPLLPLSAAWLLAGAAPQLYSRPMQAPPLAGTGPHVGAVGALASRAWLARLVCAVPVHWQPLYASMEHGLGANRFLHHTLAYRGPTLVLIQAQETLVVVCCPQEWRESHQYWGGPDCALLQLQPTFQVVSRAPKMLYLNCSIRGYPHGLRAGDDPRKPLLNINADFDQMAFQGVPYNIDSIEVWGCGDQASRETQLEIKKWQVKEAERQRQVKLSPADWMEHPDRYLLELAGRPQYNNSAS